MLLPPRSLAYHRNPPKRLHTVKPWLLGLQIVSEDLMARVSLSSAFRDKRVAVGGVAPASEEIVFNFSEEGADRLAGPAVSDTMWRGRFSARRQRRERCVGGNI